MLAAEGRLPEAVVACVGGGSNAIGMFAGFLDDEDVRLVGVEAAGAASLGTGRPGVLHGARSSLLADDDGQILDAHSISAGLDYPGVGPGARAPARHAAAPSTSPRTDEEALAAFHRLAETEGIIPALESSHALARALDARRRARRSSASPAAATRTSPRCSRGERIGRCPSRRASAVDELLIRARPGLDDVAAIAPRVRRPDGRRRGRAAAVSSAERAAASSQNQLRATVRRARPACQPVPDRGRRERQTLGGAALHHFDPIARPHRGRLLAAARRRAAAASRRVRSRRRSPTTCSPAASMRARGASSGSRTTASSACSSAPDSRARGSAAACSGTRGSASTRRSSRSCSTSERRGSSST